MRDIPPDEFENRTDPNTGEALSDAERAAIEEERRREAEREADLEAQRQQLQQRGTDDYVHRRVEAEFLARREIDEQQRADEIRAAGGHGESNLALLAIVGVLIALAVLLVIHFTGAAGPPPEPGFAPVGFPGGAHP